MVHKGDVKIVAQMLRNLEKASGSVEFKAPLVVAAPTYNIIDELKEEGDWAFCRNIPGLSSMILAPKNTARESYENILYLERPGCNLCMGNQAAKYRLKRAIPLLPPSTRLFKGRVVEDSTDKKGKS